MCANVTDWGGPCVGRPGIVTSVPFDVRPPVIIEPQTFPLYKILDSVCQYEIYCLLNVTYRVVSGVCASL